MKLEISEEIQAAASLHKQFIDRYQIFVYRLLHLITRGWEYPELHREACAMTFGSNLQVSPTKYTILRLKRGSKGGQVSLHEEEFPRQQASS